MRIIDAAVIDDDDEEEDDSDERKTGGTREIREMLYQGLAWRSLSLALWRGLGRILWLVVLDERQGRLHHLAILLVERGHSKCKYNWMIYW